MAGVAEIDGIEIQQLGRSEPVDPRSIWSHEALNFTPWRAQNADRLAEALGIELEVGGCSLDIFGKDQANDVVLIVENQLGESDQNHQVGEHLLQQPDLGSEPVGFMGVFCTTPLGHSCRRYHTSGQAAAYGWHAGPPRPRGSCRGYR